MGSRGAPMIRRNSDQRQIGAWASSPRTKLVLFFVSFALTYGAIRAWQIIIESDNIYLETAAAFITVVVLFGIYWYFMRQYTAHRRRLNELRQAHPATTPEEDVDLNMVQLRLYLRRVYGNSVNIDALLETAGGLTPETIASLVRNYTFSGGKASAKVEEGEDLELGLGRTESNITGTPPISRYCSVDAVEYERVERCRHSDEPPPLPFASYSAVPEECSVCLMEYRDGDMLTELPCRHTYHQGCVTQWLLRHNACPMCKQMVLPLPPLWPLAAARQEESAQTAPSTIDNSAAPLDVLASPPVSVRGEDSATGGDASELPPLTSASATASPTPSSSTAVDVTAPMQAPLRVEDFEEEEEELRSPCITPKTSAES